MPRRTYECSWCGKTGHNKRTCPDRAASRAREILDYVPPSAPFEGVIVEKDIPFVAETLDEAVAALAEKNEGEEMAAKKSSAIWKLVEKVIPEARLVLLYGPPGTGKTTAANNVARPESVYNITLTEETPSAELRGHWMPRGVGEWDWHDGPAMRAFKSGARLVLNEIDKASGDALSFCHALLDDPGISAITLPTGDTLTPHENFRVIATMNGVPHDLPDAIRDRFAVSFEINEPHPDAIARLPLDLQEAAREGISYDQERSVSLRAWYAFATLREAGKITEREAAKAVFGKRASTILDTLKIARGTK